MQKQYAGLLLSPDWISKPAQARPYVKAVAADGYGAAILFSRHAKATLFDRTVHDAVKVIVRQGHALGLKMLLDDDPKWWGEVCAERHPEAAMQVIQPVEAQVVAGGAFEVHAPIPRMGKGQIVFDNLAAAFTVRDGQYRPLPPSRLRVTCANMGSHPRWDLLVRGTVIGNYAGPLVLYPVFRSFGWPDMAHPHYLRMQKELIDLYADVPLDGFSWDEPGAGKQTVGGYKTGAGFERLFRRLCGYELRPSLIWLDHGDGTERAVRIRHDYYRALAEMHMRAQGVHNRYARRCSKRELAFGTHQTFSGIPLDLGNGAMDYFRWGQVLTAAWTDGSWDFLPRNLIFHLMLADGLRKELGLRDAYYNDWTAALPAVENMRFATRCKLLFHVNWFNIFFSPFNEGEASPLSEPLHAASRREAANLDRFDAFLGGPFRPRGDVAMLYAWEGIATAPLRVSRAYFCAIQNAALCLTDRNIATDILSPASLARGRIEAEPDGDDAVSPVSAATAGADLREGPRPRGPSRVAGFAVNGQRYRAIIVPYPHALPAAAYARLMAIVAAGIPVIVFGLPPEFALEAKGGRCIREDFARRVGFQPFGHGDFLASAMAQGRVPGAEDWEPGWLDAVFPVAVTTGRETRDREGRPLFIRASAAPLYYMPVADPRDDLCNLVETVVSAEAGAFAERTYYRFFIDAPEARRRVLVVAAKGYVSGDVCETDESIARLGGKRQPVKTSGLKALFRLEEGTLTVQGGTWCAVKFEGNAPAESISDGACVLWNGTPLREAATRHQRKGEDQTRLTTWRDR